MRLVWSPEALADRSAIFDHIAKENPRAAVAMDDRFRQAATGLVDFPQMGKTGLIAGTRELIPHDHYRLVYEIHDEDIWIMAVVSTWQQWPPLK